MVYIYKIKTKIGGITLASDGIYLTGLWLDNQKYYLDSVKGDMVTKNIPIFNKTKKWLDIYFEGRNPNFKIPLKLEGTAFRKKVWEILMDIPYGTITTYGAIAKQLEKKYHRKVSARAVGGAVGHNPISIIVPCHRVIGKDGTLTGYAGGLDNKIKLLKLEKILIN